MDNSNCDENVDAPDIGMTREPHVTFEPDDGDGERDGRSGPSDGKIFTIDVDQSEEEDQRHLRGTTIIQLILWDWFVKFF
jgi:hypothetical protein